MQSKSNWEKHQEKKKQMQIQFRNNVTDCKIELRTLLYTLDDLRDITLERARDAKRENNLVLLKGMKGLLSHVLAQRANVQTMQNNLEILSMQMEVNDSILGYTKSLISLTKVAKEQSKLATPDITRLTKTASGIFSAITTEIPELSTISPIAEISQVGADYSAITESELDALIEGEGAINLQTPAKAAKQSAEPTGTMNDVLNAMNEIGSNVSR